MAASYLRRFKRSQLLEGEISPDVFMCDDGDVGLSLHERDPPLHDDNGVAAYQDAFRMDSGTRLGICEVGTAWFTGMQLPISVPPDDPGEPYADHHRELRPCPELEQRAQLAKGAVKLLEYRRK